MTPKALSNGPKAQNCSPEALRTCRTGETNGAEEVRQDLHEITTVLGKLQLCSSFSALVQVPGGREPKVAGASPLRHGLATTTGRGVHELFGAISQDGPPMRGRRALSMVRLSRIPGSSVIQSMI
jgi:hypothetical protein